MDNHKNGMEINLMEYCTIVWRRRAIVAAFVIAGAIISIAASFISAETYRASAVITPVKSQDSSMGGGISTLAQQFGGLAGISLPDAGSNSEIVSLLSSNILREKVLKRKGVMQMIFADRWDEGRKEWSGEGESSLLSAVRPNASAAGPAPAGGAPPTLWEGIRRLKEMVSVVQSARENTITITADAPRAETAARTVEYILDTLNEHMSSEAQRVARVNRAYLESELKSAADPIIRQKIYGLVARQIEMDMMAEVKENFAFKVIDPPMVPDRRISPRRTRMVGAGTGASLIIGIFAAFLFDFALRLKCRNAKAADRA